jgi:hypothetical protein
MSASPIGVSGMRLHVLPRVWATAAAPAATCNLAAAAGLQQRKPPHRLVLVQACQEQQQQPVPVVLETSRQRRTVEPGLAFYRKYTQALLRRYMRMSMEAGRAPSLLGRELFRGQVTHYTMQGFDDSVILVHDVGRCLEQLDPGLRHLVRRIALEEYTHSETAAMLGITLRTVIRRYFEALDKLTRVLLERKILQPLMEGLEAE